MRHRSSVFVLALLLVTGVSVWQIRSAGQEGATPADTWLTAYDAWERGDYPDALEWLAGLLRSPAADEYRDRVALLTGELFVTTEITDDGRNPALSADGRYVSFETGTAPNTVTRIARLTPSGTEPVAAFTGAAVVFHPTGARVAGIRPPAAAARAANASEFAWLTATDGELVVLDLDSGAERVWPTGGLLKTAPVWSGDGDGILFVGSAPDTLTKTDIYLARDGVAPTALTTGPGFKTNVQAGGTRGTFVYQSTATPAFRDPAGLTAGGGRGGRGGRGSAPTVYTVVPASGEPGRTIGGVNLTLSADGSTVAWMASDGATTTIHLQAAGGGEDVSYPVAPVRVSGLAISPDGQRVAYQHMARTDWEIYVLARDGTTRRLTQEIQHDLLPRFLTNSTLLAMMGESRHRRSHLYDLETAARTRLFDNNVVRTISPEYAWVANANGTHLAIQADRDGDTVSARRGISVVDLTRKVTVADVLARIDRQLATERDLRARMTAAFSPVADEIRRVLARMSLTRVYDHERTLVGFGSKHVSQPGNALAIDYLENAYRSFGYDPELQAFEARGNQSANVLATKRGTVDPDLIYVVGSHFDSVAAGPGADDNTSGTAALLETARVLAEIDLPTTVIFASFTGEEAGLLGSREFVRQAADNLRIVGALNNDMIGWAADRARADNTIRYSNAGIKDVQHGAAFLFTDLVTYDAKYYRSTDAAAFYEGWGDIVGGIGSYPVLANPNYHQPTDLLETMSFTQILETAKVTAATIVYLTSSPSRLGGLSAERSGAGVRVSWRAAVESGVSRYIVAYGPADDPLATRVTVTAPSATLPTLAAGTHVAVKAVNDRGLEGWDWARIVIQ